MSNPSRAVRLVVFDSLTGDVLAIDPFMQGDYRYYIQDRSVADLRYSRLHLSVFDLLEIIRLGASASCIRIESLEDGLRVTNRLDESLVMTKFDLDAFIGCLMSGGMQRALARSREQ